MFSTLATAAAGPTASSLLPAAPLADPTAPWLPREPPKFPELGRDGRYVLGVGLAHERSFLEDLAQLPPAPPWRKSWAEAHAHAARHTTQPCATVFFRHIRKCGGSSLRDLFRADPSFEHVQYDLPRARLIPRDACTVGHGECHQPEHQPHDMPGKETLLDAATAPQPGEDEEEAPGDSGGLVWQLLHNDTFVQQHPRLLIEYHSPFERTGRPFLNLLRSLPAIRRAQARRGCGVLAMTTLREPASQLQSDFDYFDAHGLTLKQYAQLNFEVQLRALLLSGVTFPKGMGLMRPGANATETSKNASAAIDAARSTYGPFFESADAAAATASAILAQFDLVGVMDHLDPLQKLLAETLDLRNVDGGRIDPKRTNAAAPPPLDGEGDDDDDALSYFELLQQTPATQIVHKVWLKKWEAEYGA